MWKNEIYSKEDFNVIIRQMTHHMIFIIHLLNDKHPYTTSYSYSYIKKNTFSLEENKYDLKYSAL